MYVCDSDGPSLSNILSQLLLNKSGIGGLVLVKDEVMMNVIGGLLVSSTCHLGSGSGFS